MDLTGKISEQGLDSVKEPEFAMGHHKIARTWIVIADARRAKLYLKTKKGLEKIAEAANDHPPVDIEDDSSGRVKNPGTGEPVKYEEHHGSLVHHEELFAKELSEFLEKAAYEDIYDRIVISAAPGVLGFIRENLGSHASKLVYAEIDKDLSLIPEKDLPKHLDDILLI